MVELFYYNSYIKSATYSKIKSNDWGSLNRIEMSKKVLENTLPFADLIRSNTTRMPEIDRLYKLAKSSLERDFLKPKLFEEITRLREKVSYDFRYSRIFYKMKLKQSRCNAIYDILNGKVEGLSDVLVKGVRAKVVAQKIDECRWWNKFEVTQLKEVIEDLKSCYVIFPLQKIDQKYDLIIGLFEIIFGQVVENIIDEGDELSLEHEINEDYTPVSLFELKRSKTDLAELIQLLSKSEIFYVEGRPAQTKELRIFFETMIGDSINVHDLIRERYKKEPQLENKFWVEKYIPRLVKDLIEIRQEEKDKRKGK